MTVWSLRLLSCRSAISSTLRRSLVWGSSLAIAAAAGAPCAAVAQPAEGYRDAAEWGTLPDGRDWGAVSGVDPDPDGEHIWVLDRCGANGCLGSDLDPVLKLDRDGKVVESFGGGLMAWPHGFFVDHRGDVWVADGPTGARAEEAAAAGKGQQVFRFAPDGELLMTLGRAGVSGRGPNTFTGPSDVLVAPDGEIYVLDGHGAGGNNRVVKFAPDGRFLSDWGTSGPGPAAGELADPHALAMDDRGRIFIADRGNIRIQIFDEDGRFLEQWTHFGPASDIFIDGDDTIYVTDTQTGALPEWYAHRRGTAWTRGIRIGNARTGEVTAFIPSEAEFVAADADGNVYGGEVPGRRLVRYVKRSR